MTPANAFSGLDTPGRIAGTVIAGLVIEAVVVWRFGWRPPLAAYSYLAVAGAVVCATDLAGRRVPVPVVLPAYPIAAVLLAVASAPSGPWWPVARAGIAAALLGGFYLTLGLAFPAGMGLGDVKWAGVTGAYLGWLGWSATVTGTLIAFVTAAVILAVTRLAGRRQESLPMAPFMTLGAVIAVLATRKPPMIRESRFQRAASPITSANARFATIRANLLPPEGRSTTTRTPAPPSWASSASSSRRFGERRP